jgi:Flp pilus assembly protein TadD
MIKRSTDVRAYELYLQGSHIYSHETRERLEACRQKFLEASTVDPEFARAWGYLAYVTMRGIMLGWRPKIEAALAEEYAKRAVTLDPDDYINYWDLAFVYQCMGRIDLARRQYEKALQLNSNDADLLAEVAECMSTPAIPSGALPSCGAP